MIDPIVNRSHLIIKSITYRFCYIWNYLKILLYILINQWWCKKWAPFDYFLCCLLVFCICTNIGAHFKIYKHKTQITSYLDRSHYCHCSEEKIINFDTFTIIITVWPSEVKVTVTKTVTVNVTKFTIISKCNQKQFA